MEVFSLWGSDLSVIYNLTLFNAHFYPEGLKTYTSNIYKQPT